MKRVFISLLVLLCYAISLFSGENVDFKSHLNAALLDTIPTFSILEVENRCYDEDVEILISLEGTPPFQLDFDAIFDTEVFSFIQIIDTTESLLVINPMPYLNDLDTTFQLHFHNLEDVNSSAILDTTLTIDILYAPTTDIRNRICEEDQIIVNGTVYDKDNRSGVEVFAGEGLGGCDSIVRIALQYDPLVIDAGEDVFTLRGDDIELRPIFQTSGLRDRGWIGSDGTSYPNDVIINVQPKNTTTYTFTITDRVGCSVSDHVTIYIT